ncbi:MAG: MFS transporter [Spongiibacteraceae bacterium]
MSVLFLTVVIDLIGFGIIIPIMPFLAPQLGGDDFDIAMIIAIYSVFAGVCGPFWGKLSDRLGRKPIILTCLAGTALSYVLLAFSTSLTEIYVSRAFCGLMAGNFGVASAMIADLTTPQNRAKGMGLIGAAFGLGMVIGPFMGGVLSGDDMDFTRPAIAAACLSLLAMTAGSFFLKESLLKEQRQQLQQHNDQAPTQSLLAMLKNTGNTLLICQYFIHNTCVSMVGYLFPLMVRDQLSWGPKEVGIVFGIQGIIMALLQGGVIGRVSSRFGELRCLMFGVSFMLTGLLCFSLIADNTSSILASVFITITGATFCMPMLNTLTSKRTPPHLRGRMLGTTTSMSAWGRVCAPLLGGAVLGFGGYSFAWLAGALFATAFLAWVVSELYKPARDTALDY